MPSPGFTEEARKASIATRQAGRRARLDRFADLLAEGIPLLRAAALLGVSENAARAYLREIRAALGWQAA